MDRYQFTPEVRAALEGLQQPFAVYQSLNKRVIPLLFSEGFRDLFGYEDLAQVYRDLGQDLYRDVHPDDVARIANAAFRFATEDRRYEVIYRVSPKNRDGYTVIHAQGKHVHLADGTRLAQIWYMDEGSYVEGADSERTELNQTLNAALHEESILKASHYDELTGLPSMSWFFELAEEAKKAGLRNGGALALLYMDLDGMKYYNHKYGFAEGDRLLQSFAKALADMFKDENCCHIGADRFAVITEEEGLEEKLKRFFRRVRELNGANSLPLRVGVYSLGTEEASLAAAFDQAKIACDAVKKSEVSAYSFYDREMSDVIRRRQYIQENIDRAIGEGWIQVCYQPIVRAVNRRVCDEEALARWNDPEAGRLSPAEFIPTLEDSGQIYKLDLYVLEQVLAKIRRQAEAGLFIVPHSINLSRADFDACDMVEEIRRRVDEAGVRRDKITIEITESVIGSDFAFIKEQVERFQSLGFAVWMDDFGSGYSSLDVLQSIKFNLLKFDMSFMRKLDEGDSGKIILTELMKMATALGVDTVCEGVETEAQARFLQEIGCSKLQGFYFCKPIPSEDIFTRYRRGVQIGYEDPEESAYFDAVGRVNLYDIAAVANEDEGVLQNYFDTLPASILEVRDGVARYVRSSRSYRDFVKRFFGVDLAKERPAFGVDSLGYGESFAKMIRQCCESKTRSFFDERLPDGSVAHSFARRIGMNPVTGDIAVAVAVLSISDPEKGTTYADVAGALAADYYNIYVVDMDSDAFIEYSSTVGGDEMSVVRRGADFFTLARRDTMKRIYEEDQELFLALFTKENVVRDLDRQGVFTATYRLTDTGEPMYVHMKVTRLRGGNRIILGVSVIDAQMKKRRQIERVQKDRDMLARIMALNQDYLSLYTINPETGAYVEYTASADYESLGFAKEGEDFFTRGRIDGERTVCPEDLPVYLEEFERENVLRRIREEGIFQLRYRLVIRGEERPVILKIAAVREGESEKLVAGVRAWRVRR